MIDKDRAFEEVEELCRLLVKSLERMLGMTDELTRRTVATMFIILHGLGKTDEEEELCRRRLQEEKDGNAKEREEKKVAKPDTSDGKAVVNTLNQFVWVNGGIAGLQHSTRLLLLLSVAKGPVLPE